VKTLVPAATFPTAPEADLACQQLRAAGLHAWVRDGGIVSVHALLGPAVGWVKVEVPPDELDEARALLSEVATVDGFAPGRLGADPPDLGRSDEAEARRPLAVALLCFGLLPVVGHLWSLHLLWSSRRVAWSPRALRLRRTALSLDLLVLALVVLVLCTR
jgi:hypothetical protein